MTSPFLHTSTCYFPLSQLSITSNCSIHSVVCMSSEKPSSVIEAVVWDLLKYDLFLLISGKINLLGGSGEKITSVPLLTPSCLQVPIKHSANTKWHNQPSTESKQSSVPRPSLCSKEKLPCSADASKHSCELCRVIQNVPWFVALPRLRG